MLLDVFGADASFGERSREALRTCRQSGKLIACEVVWAETAAWFAVPADGARAFELLGIAFDPMDDQAALAAAAAWRAYRRRGGKRDRVMADFLIGAHARRRADQLLTRDRGFYRSRFTGLTLVDPSRGRAAPQ